MPASICFLAVLLVPGLEFGHAPPQATGADCRFSVRECTSFRGAKGDSTSLAFAQRPGRKNVPRVRGVGRYSFDTAAAVRQGLRQGEFPWYDSGADRVRPVWAPRMSWLKRLRQWFDGFLDAIGRFFKSLGFGNLPSVGIRGDWLGTILLATVLAAFFVFLLVIWLRREPVAGAGGAARARPGSAQLLAQLAGDSALGLDDPWAEAQRRHLAGDKAGAIIYLFAHQLISLDRAGLIRLAPGWTGRQYVRWLRDPVLVDSLAATLGLFEEIYYGHRLPSQGAFDRVWGRAQALEDRRSELERSR
jgi:Domain of unknown function (DUF4129)